MEEKMKHKIILFLFLLILISLVFIGSTDISNNEGSSKGLIVKSKDYKRWAICVGINDYIDDSFVDLKYCNNDANGLSKTLLNNGQFDNVYTMTDRLDYRNKLFPSSNNINAMIDFVLKVSNKDDLIVFSFSGHGFSKNNDNYLLGIDSKEINIENSSVSLNWIIDRIKQSGHKKVVLFIDACREKISNTKGNSVGVNGELYLDSEVAAVFFATKSGWSSYEDSKSEYGVFTKYIILGLLGKADFDNDKYVSFNELIAYVEKEVLIWASKNLKKQKPYIRLINEKFGDLYISYSSYKDGIVDDYKNEKVVLQVNIDGDISEWEDYGKKYKDFVNDCLIDKNNIVYGDISNINVLRTNKNLYMGVSLYSSLKPLINRNFAIAIDINLDQETDYEFIYNIKGETHLINKVKYGDEAYKKENIEKAVGFFIAAWDNMVELKIPLKNYNIGSKFYFYIKSYESNFIVDKTFWFEY